MKITYFPTKSKFTIINQVRSGQVAYLVDGSQIHYFKPTITITDTMVTVEAPYNPDFIARASQLGGLCRDKKWHFSYQEEIEVRKACELYFGYDGITDPIKADLTITFTKELTSSPGRSIDIVGRPIARITNNSVQPLIAPGTLIQSGTITAKGNRAHIAEGTILTLRSVPMSLVENHKPHDHYTLDIIDLNSHALEILFLEYDQLIKRTNEIKNLLEHSNINIQQFYELLKDRNERRIAAG